MRTTAWLKAYYPHRSGDSPAVTTEESVLESTQPNSTRNHRLVHALDLPRYRFLAYSPCGLRYLGNTGSVSSQVAPLPPLLEWGTSLHHLRPSAGGASLAHVLSRAKYLSKPLG